MQTHERRTDAQQKDKHLGRYLHIIRDSPVYPVIYDANRTVLSLPPIINGNHSKITLNTKNVLIEITATDKTKVEIVNHMLIAMFAGYCESIEAIKIVSDHNNESRISPDLSPREWKAEVDYLNNVTGLDLSPEEISKLLSKMGHDVSPSKTDKNILDVSVPITRADILHQADIMEDYSIAYGFNKLPRVYPNKTAAVSAPLPINKLADIVRLESASAGWTEVMPLILCSHEENFEWLNRIDDGKTAIKLANPKTAEYQLVRTSLLPGLLKTINSNKHHSVPMKIFEVSDVGFKDETQERKSRNERHFAAAIMGKTSGFEQVHGLLDRLMLMLRSKFMTREDGLKNAALEGYWIEEVEGKPQAQLVLNTSMTIANSSLQTRPSSPATRRRSRSTSAARTTPSASSASCTPAFCTSSSCRTPSVPSSSISRCSCRRYEVRIITRYQEQNMKLERSIDKSPVIRHWLAGYTTSQHHSSAP
jgi:phenylalanyl-tRNA synthetase beta chain